MGDQRSRVLPNGRLKKWGATEWAIREMGCYRMGDQIIGVLPNGRSEKWGVTEWAIREVGCY
jgi:hypothetical protein